ncbi:hypothetical protein AURDEDRAFT_167741 [Auricularia subglabra TFB-10046 SS5]|nr:hypothetical protein AURDEDRAFT_167741 [Auricularia subglabra TFB-10046 SS5]
MLIDTRVSFMNGAGEQVKRVIGVWEMLFDWALVVETWQPCTSLTLQSLLPDGRRCPWMTKPPQTTSATCAVPDQARTGLTNGLGEQVLRECMKVWHALLDPSYAWSSPPRTMISPTEIYRLACQSDAARASCRGRLRGPYQAPASTSSCPRWRLGPADWLPQCWKALVAVDIAGTGARDCNR